MSWRVSHRQLLVLIAPVALAAVLSGCGGAAAPDTSATPTTLAVPTLSTPPTPRPVTTVSAAATGSTSATTAPTTGSAAAAATTTRPTSPTSAPAASAATDGKVYVVEEGDTLAVIANKVYGDSSLWQKIFEANKDVIGNDPDHIQIGMKLKIPPKS